MLELLTALMMQADVQLHSFSNGTSTATKTDNWQQIQKICSHKNLPLPVQLMQATAKVCASSQHRAVAFRRTTMP